MNTKEICGLLTKHRFIAAALELHSLGRRLNEEMAHELSRYVTFKTIIASHVSLSHNVLMLLCFIMHSFVTVICYTVCLDMHFSCVPAKLGLE